MINEINKIVLLKKDRTIFCIVDGKQASLLNEEYYGEIINTLKSKCQKLSDTDIQEEWKVKKRLELSILDQIKKGVRIFLDPDDIILTQ